MADSNVGINEPAVIDKRLDTNTIDRGAGTVHRERVILAKPDSVEDYLLDEEQVAAYTIDPNTPLSLPVGLDSLVGPWLPIGQFKGLRISTSASGLIEGHVDWSNDDDAVKVVNHTIDSGLFLGGAGFTLPKGGLYYRIRVDVLAAAAVDFAVTTWRIPHIVPFEFPVGGTIDASWPAWLTKTVITGEKPDGSFANVGLDRFDRLRVSQRGDETLFGEQVTVPRVNQFDIQFHEDVPENLLNVVSDTGSGSSTQTEGMAVFSSGADATMEYVVESPGSVIYAAAHEIYLYQTLSWPTPPTGASDLAMAGLFDHAAQEGYRWGYKGTSWGIQYFRNGAEVSFTPQASFSEDALSGAASSLFTRDGTPEAIDLTKVNIFRIRFGWLSADSTIFEVQAPDARWVVVHEIKHPNLNSSGQLVNPNLMAHLVIAKSLSDATNIQMRSGCWAGGIGIQTQIGQQPDGDYVAIKADGTAIVEDDTSGLGGGGVYLSAWIDTDGWATAELLIATDQPSVTNGIEIEFTDDVQGAQTVRASRFLTFAAADVAIGAAVFRFPTELDGLRIRYTNDVTPSTFFFLNLNLRTAAISPQSSFEATVGETNIALMSRSLILARNAGGTYGNVERGTAGGLDVGIVQHEVDTPIKALVSMQVAQQLLDLAGTPEQIATPALANRRTISIKNNPSNGANDVIYVGHSGAVSSNTGFPLSRGDSVEIEVDDTVVIYAVGTANNIRVAWMEVAA